MNWFNRYMDGWKHYAVFSGRTDRAGFYAFVLVNLVLEFVLVRYDLASGHYDPRIGLGVASGLFTIITIVPMAAVAVRRLHDMNWRGWWALFAIVPFATMVALLVGAFPGTEGENRFGPEPV